MYSKMALGRHLLSKLFFIIQIVSTSFTLSLDGCNKPLGVSNGQIPDEALTASSSHDLIVGPHRGRLGREEGGGAWCPKSMVDQSQKEFLEIYLGKEPKIVTGIGTQGRFANNFGVEFTPGFTVEFISTDSPGFQLYALPPGSNRTVVLTGNTDTYTEIRNEFKFPLLATRVRVRPISAHPRVVCLRLELYGCENTDLNYYTIDGKRRKYHVGEGSLFDGIIVSSVEIKDPSPIELQNAINITHEYNQSTINRNHTDFNSSKSTKKYSMTDDGYSNINEYYDNEFPDEYLNPNLSPDLPPGEVILPETPLNVTFTFVTPRRFAAVFFYFDPVQLLLKGKEPNLTVSLRLISTNFSELPTPIINNFSLNSPTHNLSVSLDGRKSRVLNAVLSIEDAELILQEVYFESDCDCSSHVTDQSIPQVIDHSNHQGTDRSKEKYRSTESVPKSKNSYFSDLKSPFNGFIKDSETPFVSKGSQNKRIKDRYSDQLKRKFIGESNADGNIRESDRSVEDENNDDKNKINENKSRAYILDQLKINRTTYRNEVYKNKISEGKGTTTVWIVHTASTHRTYVGVAVGFSVGVVLLLTVWLWVWAKSGRTTKVSSPRMFRRSTPADALDMTCLMEGNLVDWGSSLPPSGDTQSLCLSSSLRKDNKKQTDSSKVPLLPTMGSHKIATINPPEHRGSSLYNCSSNYGFSMPRYTERDSQKRSSFFSRQKGCSSLSKIKSTKPLSQIQSALKSSIYMNTASSDSLPTSHTGSGFISSGWKDDTSPWIQFSHK